MVFTHYVSQGNLAEIKARVNTFFAALLPDDVETYIKDLITPKARATLKLSAALEFPRNILQPVNPQTYEVIANPDAKVSISFGEMDFEVDTQNGIDINTDIAFALTPAQIGNTGLILEFDSLKLDLSKKRNIEEAANYPVDFMGVYIENARIILPKKWFNNVNNTTLQIAGRNILIGTGGFSGTVALEAVNNTPTTDDDYLTAKIGENFAIGFRKFDIVQKYFANNQYITNKITEKQKKVIDYMKNLCIFATQNRIL